MPKPGGLTYAAVECLEIKGESRLDADVLQPIVKSLAPLCYPGTERGIHHAGSATSTAQEHSIKFSISPNGLLLHY